MDVEFSEARVEAFSYPGTVLNNDRLYHRTYILQETCSGPFIRSKYNTIVSVRVNGLSALSIDNRV
jgi:hypothetical protein